MILHILKALADPNAYALRVDRKTGEIHIERIDVLEQAGARIVNIRPKPTDMIRADPASAIEVTPA